jgi:hypothetical protein
MTTFCFGVYIVNLVTQLRGASQTVVSRQLWAELYGFPYYDTSASTGFGITDMFQVSRTSLTVMIHIEGP